MAGGARRWIDAFFAEARQVGLQTNLTSIGSPSRGQLIGELAPVRFTVGHRRSGTQKGTPWPRRPFAAAMLINAGIDNFVIS